jgi:dTDP-4-dehydrorhamnose 3,5-epimerase
MKVTPTPLDGVVIIEPRIFEDSRGLFFESYHVDRYSEALRQPLRFVQDNHSRSSKHVLRGLHLQSRKPQGKLIQVINGAVFDVAVDLRPQSKSFGKWFGLELTSENPQQLWIPPGFAHGFLTLTTNAEIQYKVTDYYDPGYELSLLWNDPTIGIQWPTGAPVQLSEKDRDGLHLDQVMDQLASLP